MRPIWSGALSFGIINVPVKLYSASKERALNFRLLDRKDLCPVSYVKVCKTDGKKIPEDDIVKGYELEKGNYVIMEDEDFKNADPRKTGTIEIVNFTPEKDIDHRLYDKPYFLEPGERADKAYALIREAIKKTGLVGIARYVLKEREHIGAVTVAGKALVLLQLRFQDEIKEGEGLDFAASAEFTERELDMATLLIKELAQPFDPSKYKDNYTDALMKVIKDKAKGRKVVARTEAPTISPEDLTNLMEMLKRSLETERRKEKIKKR